MAITTTFASTLSTVETIAQNTSSAAETLRKVTHNQFDEAFTLNASSSVPATACAFFVQALTTGAATINLAALVGTNSGVIDGTGLKIQAFRVKNLGGADLVVEPGASNGYAWAGASDVITVKPNCHVLIFCNETAPDIASGARTIDLTGSSSQTSEWSIIMG